MTTPLFPPINRIRDELFGSEVLGVPEENLASPLINSSSEIENIPLPGFLKEMISRDHEARSQYQNLPPAVGQIREIATIRNASGEQVRPLGRCSAVLLAASLGDRKWRGWIVSSESDYAGPQDLLLDEDDGAFAPIAAMVQTWNEVEITLSGQETVLGIMPPHRLGAIMCLAGEATDAAFVPPRPGRLGARTLSNGETVVTGTSMGDTSDPRHEYQALYLRLAEELSLASQLAKNPAKDQFVEREGLLHAITQWLTKPGLAYAMLAVLAIQSLWLMGGLPLPEEVERYRGGSLVNGNRPECTPRIRAVLKPNAPLADALLLLRRLELNITSGPSEIGELWLTLPKGTSIDESLGMLKASPLIDQVTISTPVKDCR